MSSMVFAVILERIDDDWHALSYQKADGRRLSWSARAQAGEICSDFGDRIVAGARISPFATKARVTVFVTWWALECDWDVDIEVLDSRVLDWDAEAIATRLVELIATRVPLARVQVDGIDVGWVRSFRMPAEDWKPIDFDDIEPMKVEPLKIEPFTVERSLPPSFEQQFPSEEHERAALMVMGRQIMIRDMRRVSDAFYLCATKVGCHPFIEFAGLMNEYIEICKDAAAQGIDFPNANTHTGVALPLAEHRVDYLAEKFDCIFGPSFRADPGAFDRFIAAIRRG